jgi:hypothetical protein
MNKKIHIAQRYWLLIALSAFALHCGDSGHNLGLLLDGSPGDKDAASPDQPLTSGGAVGTGGANFGGAVATGGGNGGINTGGVGTGGVVVTGGTGIGGGGGGSGGHVTGTGGSGAAGAGGVDAAADGKSDVSLTTDAQQLAALCTSTGGQLDTMLCCTVVGDFPDMCRVGGCGCSPASSHTIAACTCPSAECFSPDVGCHSISGTGGAGGGSGTGGAGGGTGGAGGVGGTGGTSCPPVPSCNWCDGDELRDARGCVTGFICANGADPCIVDNCGNGQVCTTNEICIRDGLCWPQLGAKIAGVFDYVPNPCTTDPCLPGVIAAVTDLGGVTYIITISENWVTTDYAYWQRDWNFNGTPGTYVFASGKVTYHADINGHQYLGLRLTEITYRDL